MDNQILHLLRNERCLSSQQIKRRTGRSMYAVRKALRSLQKEGKIRSFAKWYSGGIKGGYSRFYTLRT